METLMQEINNLLEEKNSTISILKWEKERMEKEILELKKEMSSLYYVIEKYKENEVNRA